MKAKRQQKILELIQQNVVTTQEELAANLTECGFRVTQATVSRDIKELGLIKVAGYNNILHYVSPKEFTTSRVDERLKRYFRDIVVNISVSENLIVIKTQPGGAQGVAAAIDEIGWQEIIGTVGGDDTILAVIKPMSMTEVVRNRFEGLRGRQ